MAKLSKNMASPRENPSRKGKYRCRMSGCTEVFDEKYKKNLHVAFAHTEQSPDRSPAVNNTNRNTNGTPNTNTNGITNNNANTNGHSDTNEKGNGNANATPAPTNQWQAVNTQPKSNGWQAVNMPPRQSPAIKTPITTPTTATANITKPFQAISMQPKQYQSPYSTQPQPPPTQPQPRALSLAELQDEHFHQVPYQAQPQAQPPLRIQTQAPVRTTYRSPYAPMPSPLQSLQTKDSKAPPAFAQETSDPKEVTPPPQQEEPLTPLISPQHLPTHPSSPLSWGGSQLSPLSPTMSVSSCDTIELLDNTMLSNYDTRKYGPGERKSGFRCVACNLNFEERSELGLHTAFVHRGVRKLMIGTSPWGTWDVELRDEGGALPGVVSDEGELVRWGDVWGAR